MSHNQCKAFARNWQAVLSEYVKQAEEWTHSQQRHRKWSAEALVQTLVLGCLERADTSLNDFVQTAQALGVEISRSSLDERINERAVMLLAGVLHESLRQQRPCPVQLAIRLQAFRSVNLVDSTQISVPEALYAVFRGNGGKAKMKVQVGWEYLSGQLQVVECEAGRTPDQDSAVLEHFMVEGALVLFDLGYFKQERLRDMTQAGAFFVTRCQSQVALYACDSGERVFLTDILKQHPTDQYESVFQLGGRVRTPVRVVARRVAPPAAAARRRHAKAKAKSEGKTCSAAYLIWLGWDILITNLPAEWSGDDLFILYGIRWQIELVFKVWKSQLGIARYGDWRTARVMCQFYAHLIGAVLCHQSVACFRWLPGVMMSLAKSVAVIQHHMTSLLAVIQHDWAGLLRWASDLWSAFLRFAQHDKRKAAPTTLQFLMDWG